MYGSSTQLKYWTFKDETQLSNFRLEANQSFVEKFTKERNLTKHDAAKHFLSIEEERLLVKYYENSLKEFCNKFQDPRDSRIRMPAYVASTAHHYFKRYYLHNSVMDYHPKEILVTCVYVACKIEEFYVTISDFVYNVKGDRKKAADVILNIELQLNQALQFHLIIHQPFRAAEGLFIDLKTRFKDLKDPDRLRTPVDEFLDKVHLTDAILLFSPSQIAVAAVTTAASKLRENIDRYVTDVLFKNDPDQLKVLIEAVRKTKRIVKNFKLQLSEEQRMEIEKKLEICRNQENNPNSEFYRENYVDMDDDEVSISQPNRMEIDSPLDMSPLSP